jgi:hypothetical protein
LAPDSRRKLQKLDSQTPQIQLLDVAFSILNKQRTKDAGCEAAKFFGHPLRSHNAFKSFGNYSPEIPKWRGLL